MRNTKGKRNKLKKIFIFISVFLFCIASLILYFGKSLGLPDWNDIFSAVGLRSKMDDNLSVCFISVGTADAIYIHQGETDILIDAGTVNSFSNIDSFLKRYNCKTFDAVIISHPDSDHIGGMSKIIDTYGAEKLYMYNYSAEFLPKTYEYLSFENSVKENSIDKKYISAKENENKFTIGELCFEVLSPQNEYKDTNESSLVLRMNYGQHSFLFTGDITEEVEADLLSKYQNLDCDVLKVAHHGSKYSSSQEFLNAISPEISVISVGDDNNYLPDLDTEARLADVSDLYITSRDENILIRSDKITLKVQTKV